MAKGRGERGFLGLGLTGYIAVGAAALLAASAGAAWLQTQRLARAQQDLSVARASIETLRGAVSAAQAAVGQMRLERDRLERVLGDREEKLRWAWSEHAHLEQRLEEAGRDQGCSDVLDRSLCPAVIRLFRAGAEDGDGTAGGAGAAAGDTRPPVPAAGDGG